jgi:phosphoglycerate kinase
MGVYEEPNFVDGTKLVASAVAGSNAYSVLGGGDTQTAIEACGFKKEQFSYVSLAGKASLEYLSGKELPGVMILKKK